MEHTSHNSRNSIALINDKIDQRVRYVKKMKRRLSIINKYFFISIFWVMTSSILLVHNNNYNMDSPFLLFFVISVVNLGLSIKKVISCEAKIVINLTNVEISDLKKELKNQYKTLED